MLEANRDEFGSPSKHIREVEGGEWWLWGLAVAVSLVLTFGIVSITFPGLRLPTDETYSLNLKEWVRGLAALVLLFDIYTVYQHLRFQRIRRKLAEREQLFELITENAADMIAVVNRDGRRLYNSPAYQKTLGYSAGELTSGSALDQVHPDDRDRLLEASQKAYLTGRGERLEYRIRHKDGSWRVLESTSNTISGKNGEAEGLVIVNRDITERKRTEALLERHAFYDDLTDLPNRALFLDRLQRAMALSQRRRDFRFAVLFIDIDEFKMFNDSLGQSAGDELLIKIASRLKQALCDHDTLCGVRAAKNGQVRAGESTLARPGGDEFLVLAEDVRDPSDAIRVSELIQERLAQPVEVMSNEIVVNASIGIAFSTDGYTQAGDILRDAEIAMYRAKQAGRARCEVFDSAMHSDAMNRLQLEADLRRGLQLNEFHVHYQPLISLETNRIVGFEALSRWHRPQGVVMPGEFIKVADETGIILPLNRGLLREACMQLQNWQQQFCPPRPLMISANITARQFVHPDLATEIGKILEQSGTDPACLDLEITENIAMADPERSSVVLSELKALGVRLSIDDFGTGYSSLCRLQKFPVDVMKIDRAFISQMDRDSESHEIVRIIVMLGKSLGMKIVAEGVERAEQIALLKHMGCDLVQGFLFSKPVEADSADQLLRSQAVNAAVGAPLAVSSSCSIA
jgi:diguanylate cyclase (GGDEF)-like protein/PAS domain S-box-containing protein